MRVAHVCNPGSDNTALPLRVMMAGDHTVIQSSISPVREGVATVALPVAGRAGSRFARYRGLGAALADAELVRLYADPGTAVARQVARHCRRPGAPPLVIEVDHMAGHSGSLLSWLVARRVLARSDAVVARHRDGLARLRRLGFRGIGFIAGTGVARLGPDGTGRLTGPLTVAFAPVPLTLQSGAIDLLEAVAAHPDTVLLAAPLEGHQLLADRAAALDMIDRLRFVPVADLLGQADVLVAVPHPQAATRMPYDHMIEEAQAAGIPVIASDVAGLAELVGAGGWMVPPGDAGAIFELLRTKLDRRDILDVVGLRAATHHAARQADCLNGPGLRQVMEAAATRSHRGAVRRRSGSGTNAAIQP